MTNQLPGNPHAKDFRRSVSEFGQSTIGAEGLTDATIIWEGLRQLGEATLAVAYEQRTANMIRFIEIIDDRTDLKHRIAVIEQRLGRDHND